MHLQDAEIERRIELETKAEKHIQKLLLLGVFYLVWLSLFYIAIRRIIWNLAISINT